MGTSEYVGLRADHPFVDVLAPNAREEFVNQGHTWASYDSADIDDFLKSHPEVKIGAERFTISEGPSRNLYCLRSWDFSFRHNWAIKLLKEKGHRVGNYHPAD